MSSSTQGPVTLRALLEDPNLANPQESAEKSQKKEDVPEGLFSSQSAFLGPNLWDKTLSLDFELEYMDIDEFLTENVTGMMPSQAELALTQDQLEIQVAGGSSPPCLLTNDASPMLSIDPMTLLNLPKPMTSENVVVEHLPQLSPGQLKSETSTQSSGSSLSGCVSQQPNTDDDATNDGTSSSGVEEEEVAVDIALDPVDISLATIPGYKEFDPRRAKFSDQELRPQPMLRKSKKVFVDDEEKDDKYWDRRRKNNVAAKRSRDARRIKENQIALRATFLEKENEKLKEELRVSRQMNKDLMQRLAKYEEVSST